MNKEFIFHVRTQKAYDALMQELHGKATWLSRDEMPPIKNQNFHVYKSNTLIYVSNEENRDKAKFTITFGDKKFHDYSRHDPYNVFTPSNKLNENFEIYR